MKRASKKTTSPVIQLLDHVYTNALKADPRSYQRINYAMRNALEIAIGSLFEFDIGDFKHIFSNFNSGFWRGDDVEHWYSKSVADGNASAFMSFEHYAGREQLRADDVTPVESHYAHLTGSRAIERLHVGAEFQWLGYRVKVTSFNNDGSCNACAYPKNRWVVEQPTSEVAAAIELIKSSGRNVHDRHDEKANKPIKRFKINRDAIISERAERKRRKEIVDAVLEHPEASQQAFMDSIGNPKKDEFAQMPLKKLESAFAKLERT